MRKPKIGVVGLGYGQRVLIPAFRSTGLCEVIAVCGGNLNRAKDVADRLKIPKAYGGLGLSQTNYSRVIALLGMLSVLAAILISAWVIWAKLAHAIPIQGWTSLVVVVCLFSGLILFSLGVISEYLALTLTMAMGKPLYLVVSRPKSKSPS